MAYARVNMAEFASREDMHKTMGRINKEIKLIFPDVLAYAAMETSETSTLAFVIYKNKEDADRALANRAKFHEDDASDLSDIFSHEGNLNVYYVDDEQLDYLRGSGL